MKGAIEVAKGEIRRHRLVAGAGLVVGCVPLLLNYALEGQHLRPRQPGEPSGGEFFVAVFAMVLSFAVAAGLGLTSDDLRERRLAFWLARPLPLFEYWAGKVGAALLLSIGAGLLVLLPAHLLGSMSLADTLSDLARKWYLPLGALLLAQAAGRAIGGALQARGQLLLLDIAMAPLTWAATLLAMGAAWQAGTGRAVFEYAMPLLLLVPIAVLLTASAVQLCVGRLDLPRGHAWLSAITWGGLLVFWVGGIAGFSRYVTATTSPEDLRNVIVAAPASGSRVLLWGMSRTWSYSFVPGFLLDADGRTVDLGGLEGSSGFAWSPDGGHFAWSRERFGPTGGPEAGWRAASTERESFLDRFGWGPTLEVRGEKAWRHRLGDRLNVIAVSPGGGRVLLDSGSRKSILDTGSGLTIASLDDAGAWRSATFVDASTVRALRRTAVPIPGRALDEGVGGALWQGTVVDWDGASGRVQESATVALQGDRVLYSSLTPSEDWQRILRFDTTGLFLHDLEGRVTATLVDGWPARANRLAGPLSAGRYGCVEEDSAGLRLRVFEPGGRVSSDTRLAGRFPVRVGGEPRPGWLALGVAAVAEGGDRATLFIDLATGAVTQRRARLSPALRQWMTGYWPASAEHVAPGSFATRLFFADDGLVSFDPETAATQVLVARHGPSRED